MEQAPAIILPTATYYVAWWPWVQNYYGETNVGAQRFGRSASALDRSGNEKKDGFLIIGDSRPKAGFSNGSAFFIRI